MSIRPKNEREINKGIQIKRRVVAEKSLIVDHFHLQWVFVLKRDKGLISSVILSNLISIPTLQKKLSEMLGWQHCYIIYSLFSRNSICILVL